MNKLFDILTFVLIVEMLTIIVQIKELVSFYGSMTTALVFMLSFVSCIVAINYR